MIFSSLTNSLAQTNLLKLNRILRKPKIAIIVSYESKKAELKIWAAKSSLQIF